MTSFISLDRLRFLFNRFAERLWVRPLAICLLSVVVVFAAKFIDGSQLANFAPLVEKDSVETLLSIMASSMLVIATLSVSSMVAAYAAASNSASPRSFSLVVADDVSQNALSTFVGAFIFSVVAITAVKNTFYDKAGLFTLFVLTVFVFAVVILTFVRWVDSIARLGRVGSTIDKVESATEKALTRRRDKPTLGGISILGSPTKGQAVYTSKIGYVQHIDMAVIQDWANDVDVSVVLSALPGTFASPDQALAYVSIPSGDLSELDCTCLMEAFHIGKDRTFEDDPRFGLVTLSEIAVRALSPAVNDPGTAIKVIGTLVRLISTFNAPAKTENKNHVEFDRVAVPEILVSDMFEDAFTAIARDGAGSIEVCVRLQKAFNSLESLNNDDIQKAARYQKDLALKRACKALDIEEDLIAVKNAANKPS
ncbi:DUF2254 domain-containing protein [Psychromonas sp. 14N.309.X.WAT.B.A12]|uniref:DUF2254 domain-containing protein n=1 Tax=unclassified Psychromonas TaxID=2614957 RepID=UPI0025B26792|nr:DUF2254 domain-containing protein [Psychromonas sp. 14N.309.X.WAT.B.A12]MDN2661878.1 DUF2254 domain-containing protein [Psychromonas sp. 14N.309.X.WAT.B.A12]